MIAAYLLALVFRVGKPRSVRLPGVKGIAPTAICMGVLALAPAMEAAPVPYSFVFQQDSGIAAPLPSGGFTYDDATGLFSGFQVSLGGASYDFTAAANTFRGHAALPFELGFLAQNLITGQPVVGPVNWWADDAGFRGFEWRTPAEDFLYFDLTVNADPNAGIFTGPNAYSGTWSTQVATPEPGTLGLAAVAGLAFACKRVADGRRRRLLR